MRQESHARYEDEAASHKARETERQRRLAAAQAEHYKTVAEIEARLNAQHAEIEELKTSSVPASQQPSSSTLRLCSKQAATRRDSHSVSGSFSCRSHASS